MRSSPPWSKSHRSLPPIRSIGRCPRLAGRLLHMSRGWSSDPLFCCTARRGVAIGTFSLVGEATGCAVACSMHGGLFRWPRAPNSAGSTSEAALQVHPTNYKCWNSNIMKDTAILFLLTGWSSCATLRRSCAWRGQPPLLVAPGLNAPARQGLCNGRVFSASCARRQDHFN